MFSRVFPKVLPKSFFLYETMGKTGKIDLTFTWGEPLGVASF